MDTRKAKSLFIMTLEEKDLLAGLDGEVQSYNGIHVSKSALDFNPG